MDTVVKAENLSQLSTSKTVNGGTVCRKAARTVLWGSGEATNRSTRTPAGPFDRLHLKLKGL